MESVPISLAELRRRAQGMQTSVLRRNLREYAGSTFIIAAFGYYLWRFPTPLTSAGSVLSILGALYVMYQITQRGSARIPPADMTAHTCLDFYRRELERQRDLLRTVWSWYLLPLIPGPVLFLAGLTLEHLAGRWLPAAALMVVGAIGFLGIGWMNRSAARGLERQIDALRAMQKEE